MTIFNPFTWTKSGIKEVADHAIIASSAVAETVAVKAAKTWGITSIRAGGKALPIIGNLVAAADDIYQQHQIHNLKRTAQGLQDSQSLLKGQMKEVIAGLNEGKGREAELQAELTKINQEIELNNQNNQAKLEELQVKQQATKQLLQQQELEKQQLQAEYSFLKEQGQKVEQTLTIIGNQTELNQEQINQLQILAEEEKEQINKLEQNWQKTAEKLANLESNWKILEQNHQELDIQVRNQEEKVKQLEKEIAELRAEIKQQKGQVENKEKIIEQVNKYSQLKEEKEKIIAELKTYQAIPQEEQSSSQKWIDIPVKDLENEIVIKWLKEVANENYRLEPQTYDLYQQKYGAELMNNFVRYEEGEYNKQAAIKAEEMFQGLANYWIQDERYYSIKELQARRDLLERWNKLPKQLQEEIAAELGLYPAETTTTVNELTTPGATANTHWPWLYLSVIGLIMIIYCRKLIKRNTENKQNKANSSSSHGSLIILLLGISSLIGWASYQEWKERKTSTKEIVAESNQEIKEEQLAKERSVKKTSNKAAIDQEKELRKETKRQTINQEIQAINNQIGSQIDYAKIIVEREEINWNLLKALAQKQNWEKELIENSNHHYCSLQDYWARWQQTQHNYYSEKELVEILQT